MALSRSLDFRSAPFDIAIYNSSLWQNNDSRRSSIQQSYTTSCFDWGPKQDAKESEIRAADAVIPKISLVLLDDPLDSYALPPGTILQEVLTDSINQRGDRISGWRLVSPERDRHTIISILSQARTRVVY